MAFWDKGRPTKLSIIKDSYFYVAVGCRFGVWVMQWKKGSGREVDCETERVRFEFWKLFAPAPF